MTSPTIRESGDDLSALAWVHDELRRSLEAAHKALRRFVREAEAVGVSDLDTVDPAVLRNARSQIHQGVGALELVGLPAAATLLRASEALVQRVAAKPQRLNAEVIEAIEHASFALLDYVARLLAGKPVSPLSLFPQYRTVQEAAGAERVHPADLWSVDWQWRELPLDPTAGTRQPDAETRAALEAQLLTLMKTSDPAQPAARMSDICADLGNGADDLRSATFWKLAAAVFEVQSRGLLGFDVFSKRVASRLLAQFRALERDRAEVSERLAHDLLFFCAQSDAPGAGRAAPRWAAVRQAYGLEQHQPVDYATSSLGRFDPSWQVQAKKRVAAAKEAWSAVAAGEMHRLAGLSEQFALVGDSLKRLFPLGDVFGGELQHAVQQTQSTGEPPPAPLAMEVATSLLYIEAVLEDGEFDHPEQAGRVRRLAGRLAAVRQGRPPDPLEGWMEELYRRVSDRQTMGSVVQELRASLSEAETAIDAFFRHPADPQVLVAVPNHFSAMRGVLSVLGMDHAAAALLRMRDEVDGLITTEVDPRRVAEAGVFDRLAGNLGALGFLIDMLSVQPQMVRSLFRYDADVGTLRPVMGRAAAETATAAVTVDPRLIEQAQSLAFNSVREDVPLEDVGRELDRVAHEALAADQTALASTLQKARDAIDGAADDAALATARGDLSEALVDFVASTSDPIGLDLLPVPDVEPLSKGFGAPPAPAVDPGLGDDAEMREVFLEEALEVLADAAAAHAELASATDDLTLLTTLRRAFHTLKGSSRMVGLTSFGEAAWVGEQIYNTQLAEQKAAGPALLDFTGWSLAYLEDWVTAIAAGRRGSHDVDTMRRAADAFASGAPMPALPSLDVPPAAGAAEAAVAEADELHFEFDLDGLDTPFDTGAAPDVTVARESDATPLPELPLFELDLPFADTAAPVAALPDALEIEMPEGLDFFDAEPTASAAAAELDAEEPVRVVGPLRIGIPLFNIYLNEADELSRRLGVEIAEWSLELHRPIGETPIALAHSLAGNSATVGFADLSHLARLLEHALARSQAIGRGTEEEGRLFGDAADEIRHLLHQFAAGFLKQPSPLLMTRLADHERSSALRLEAATAAADAPASTGLGELGPDVLALQLRDDVGTSDHFDERSADTAAQFAETSAAPAIDVSVEPVDSPVATSADAVERDALAPADAQRKTAERSPAVAALVAPEPETAGPVAPLPEVAAAVTPPPETSAAVTPAPAASADIAPAAGTREPMHGALADAPAPSAAVLDAGDAAAASRELIEPLEDVETPDRLEPVDTVSATPDAPAAPDEPLRPLEPVAGASEPAESLHDAPFVFEDATPPSDLPGAAALDRAVAHAPLVVAASPAGVEPPATLPTAGPDRAAVQPLAERPVEAPRPVAASVTDELDDDEHLDAVDAVDAVDAELFPIFAEEADELLPQLASRLRDWARRPADAALPSACMRTLHTLKGGARLAGAMRLGEMAHRLETRIERLVAHAPVEAAAVEALQHRGDALSHTFETLRSGGADSVPAPSVAPLVATAPAVSPAQALRLDDAAHAAVAAQAAGVGAAADPALRLEHADHAADVAGSAAAEASDAPASAAAAASPAPTRVDAPPAATEAAGAAVLPPAHRPASVAPAAATGDAAAIAAARSVDWTRFRTGTAQLQRLPERVPTAQSSVRVRAPVLDRLVNHAGEVSITRSRIEAGVAQMKGSLADLTENLDRLRAQLRDIEFHGEVQMTSRMEAAKAAAQAFDPLEFDRFTRFQELTRMMAESVNDVATVQRSVQRAIETAEDELVVQARLTRDLHDELLRTRMVEFEGLSDRLYRVVRQAAKETGKSVRLDIEGGGVEVDRGVLDRMTGAFEHLLRNAVVHGIEPAAQRTAAGKDATGTVTVALSHEGNEVGVAFRDDGAGLDLPRIRDRAIALGVIGREAATTDAELANLIFLPGFTTAVGVTELAGRGVGMDVVRSEIDAMGGRIETATTVGRGTSFKLVLPLTTAVTQVVLLRCGETRIAVPSTLVEAVRRATPAEVDAAHASGSFMLAGASAGAAAPRATDETPLPFFWLGALLQVSPAPAPSGARTRMVVAIRSAQQRIAIHVDEVLGNHEVVVKNLGPQLSRMPGLAGITLLASGSVALIYNPVALATLYGAAAQAATRATLEAAAADAAMPTAPEREAHEPLVMVVDDSLTVRRVTQRLLVREGYRVVLAKDGLDALERLAEELPQIVLSDIEMPRMDGFDLVRNMRGDARLRDLPVIMITSRIAQKHREVAAQLGVDHYLGKPYAEEDLLALVARYTTQRVAA